MVGITLIKRRSLVRVLISFFCGHVNIYIYIMAYIIYIFIIKLNYENCLFNLQLNIIRMYQQLFYFQQYQQRLSALIGADQARQLVNDALVLITVGGNDFVNNYYLVPFSARSRQFAIPDYVVYLVSEYRKLLMVIN